MVGDAVGAAVEVFGFDDAGEGDGGVAEGGLDFGGEAGNGELSTARACDDDLVAVVERESTCDGEDGERDLGDAVGAECRIGAAGGIEACDGEGIGPGRAGDEDGVERFEYDARDAMKGSVVAPALTPKVVSSLPAGVKRVRWTAEASSAGGGDDRTIVLDGDGDGLVADGAGGDDDFTGVSEGCVEIAVGEESHEGELRIVRLGGAWGSWRATDDDASVRGDGDGVRTEVTEIGGGDTAFAEGGVEFSVGGHADDGEGGGADVCGDACDEEPAVGEAEDVGATALGEEVGIGDAIDAEGGVGLAVRKVLEEAGALVRTDDGDDDASIGADEDAGGLTLGKLHLSTDAEGLVKRGPVGR